MKLKKLFSLALTACMTVSLVACNSGSGSGSGDGSAVDEAIASVQSGEGVYKEVSEIALPEGVTDAYAIFAANDGTVYMYGSEFDWGEESFVEEIPEEPVLEEEAVTEDAEEPTEEEAVEELPEEKVVEEIPADEEINEDIPMEESAGKMIITVYKVDAEACATSEYATVELGTEMALDRMVVNPDGNIVMLLRNNSTDSAGLYMYGTNGSEIASCELPTTAGNPYHYFDAMVVDPQGNIAVTGGRAYYLLDSSLNVKVAKDIDSEGNVNGLFVDKNGAINIVTDGPESSASVVNEVSMDGTLTNVATLDTYYFSYNSCPGFDFSVEQSGTVKAYDKATGDFTVVFNCINSDIDNISFNKFYSVDDTKALVVTAGDMFVPAMFLYEKVNPEDVVPKTVVTLGCISLDGQTSKKVTEFNKKSDNVKIVVVDYSQYGTPEDTSKAELMLKNDIASNNCPDIMVVNPNMLGQIRKYANKNAFYDLSKCLANDSELSKESFLPNIIEVCTINDTLAFLPASFYVYTYGMKESLYNQLGGEASLSNIDQIEGLVSGKAIRGGTKSDVLWNAIYFDTASYVDLDNGKCNFDTDQFKSLLEYANTYPTEYEYSADPDDYVTYLRKDDSAYVSVFATDFRNINRIEKETCGENMVLVGYPSQGGSGAFVGLDTTFAISAKSQHADEAWQFVREFLLPEYQVSDEIWDLPTTNVGIDSCIAEAMSKRYNIDEMTGEKIEYDETYSIGGVEYVISPMTQDRADYYRDYISSITNLLCYDQEIMGIVNEEAAPFFAGDKTADDVAKILQSRISIYVKEQK